MQFNSLAFLIFILIFSCIFVFQWKKNIKFLLISVFSLIFYGFWRWDYIFLILFSALVDYFCGAKIYKSKNKKPWLFVSIVTNLGLLFSFKYLLFFLNTLIDFKLLPITSYPDQISIILPVGISFYTFQSMSYTIDIYRGELKPTKNFLKFFSYLSFFPQLVAGPIVRARDLLDQMEHIKTQKGDELYFGLKLIIYGFFKKMVIADGVAAYVNTAFSNPTYSESSLYWWSAAICFGIQIYCDFSGYTDIARGLARVFGLQFPLNFNHPYIASSFSDFWRRWHISLSTWFRDYVYIPLGGSRKGKIRGHLNMWITMIISGLWHGANYTFLFWGAIHAFFLSIERELSFLGKKVKIPFIIKNFIVLFFIIISWVYFRANTISQAHLIVWNMLSFNGTEIALGNWLSFILIVFVLRELYVANEKRLSFVHKNLHFIEPVWVGVMASMAFFLRGEGNTFIYFQF